MRLQEVQQGCECGETAPLCGVGIFQAETPHGRMPWRVRAFLPYPQQVNLVVEVGCVRFHVGAARGVFLYVSAMTGGRNLCVNVVF